MNPIIVVLGIFILLSFASTVLIVAASMLSSQISRAEESPEERLAYEEEAESVAASDLRKKTAPAT